MWIRCFNLDLKIYWHDEVFTSLRTAGYTGEEVIQELFTGEILTASDLLTYQTLSPNTELQQTLNALQNHPEHPPLYYLLSRFWQDWLGSSVAVMRSLSVLFSLLVFPALYGFSYSLFQSPTVASIAVLLMSVSPFHLLYAQEARQYSLWTLMTLLSSWSFWQAINHRSRFNWLAYATTTILNFYTSLLSVLVVWTQGIYLFLREKRVYNRTIRYYLLVILGSAIAFSPWIWIIITNYSQLQAKTAWIESQPAYSFLFKIWGLHFSSVFVDLGFNINHPYSYLVPPLILILISYGFIILIRTTERSIWLFLLCLFLIPTLSLILPDLILGGQRSTVTRYLIPSLIAAQIAIAYLFTYHLRKKLWQGLLGIILLCGLLSCWQISQAEVWWNKGISSYNPQIAAAINKSSNPLVISDAGGTNLGNIISLAYLVKPETKFKLVSQGEPFNLYCEKSKVIFSFDGYGWLSLCEL
jgi:uncharacterized membrane protein